MQIVEDGRFLRPGQEELKRDDEDCKWESGWSEEEVDGDDVHDCTTRWFERA